MLREALLAKGDFEAGRKCDGLLSPKPFWVHAETAIGSYATHSRGCSPNASLVKSTVTHVELLGEYKACETQTIGDYPQAIG